MSSDDERDLRQRLGSALDTITLPPAPVDTVLRKGRARRTRRHIAAAAGLAVVVGIGVAVPALVHQAVHEAPVSPAKKPTVTVNPVGPGSPRGLIGSGRINGKKWTVIAQRPGTGGAGKNSECFYGSGIASPNGECLQLVQLAVASGFPVAFDSFGDDFAQAHFGVLAPGVTQVTVILADGTRLVLRPAEAFGRRYVAFTVPVRLAVARIIAYSGPAELSYAIPFNSEGFIQIPTPWLRPGQRGLPRVTKKIGSGTVLGRTWSVTVHQGPWGYCFTGITIQCLGTESRSPGNSPGGLAAAGPAGGYWVFGTATAAVDRIRVHLSGGIVLTERAVACGSLKFYAYVIPKGHTALRVAYYSASRYLVASHSGY